MMSNKPRNKGFTILEVLITLGILSIVLISATQLLTSNVKAVEESSKDVDYTQNLRIASNQIMDQIKKKNTTKVTYDGSGLLIVDNHPLLDTTKRLSNTNNARLWLYGSGSNNAELRLLDDSGNTKVIAEYIEYITIQDNPNGNSNYLNIHIKVADTQEAVLSVPKTYAFSSVLPPEPTPNSIWGNFVTYSNRLTFENSLILGPTAIVYVTNTNSASFSMRNSNTEIRTAKVYIKKNLNMDSGPKIGFDQNSQVFVEGNITVKNQYSVFGTLFYTGSFPHAIPNSTSVSSIDFPNVDMPSPQPDPWYTQKGFTPIQNFVTGMKYKGGSITFDGKRIDDITIYSTGDITIRNSSQLSGILYAPNNKVLIDSSKFDGIIIADQIEIKNSSTVTFRSYDTNDLPF